MKAGELDMAFGMHRDDWAESVIIMRQPLYLAVPSDHPLAARHSVTFDDFAREPQVMLDKPSSLRTQMDRIFAQRGAVPNVVFEVRECNAALQYVALKFGVSVLPQVPAMDTEKVSIIPISDQDKEFVRTDLSLLVPLPPHVSPLPRGCGTISWSTTPSRNEPFRRRSARTSVFFLSPAHRGKFPKNPDFFLYSRAKL